MLHATGDWGTTFALAPVTRSQNYGDMVRVIGKWLLELTTDGSQFIYSKIHQSSLDMIFFLRLLID